MPFSRSSRRPVPPRLGTRLLLLLVALATLFVAAAVPAAGRERQRSTRAQPKVVVIVGPTGSVTSEYRAIGERAAAEARRWTRNVVALHSPNATWAAAKEAVQGASVVVYLGHGNGWPSRYRSSLWPYSQNGLGLNPVAGGGDSAHQYYGEFYLARDVRLARNAVVLLHRLCYASGNTEPGLPEGSLDQARQRVDNYAAGWIAAGARGVVADAFGDPAYYLRSLLGGHRTLQAVWADAPSDNGHRLAFASRRSPGHTALLDPEHGTSGFYRSVVGRLRVSTDQVRAGASGVPAEVLGAGADAAAALPEPEPTLAERGFRFSAPRLSRHPVAGRSTKLTIPVRAPRGEQLPEDLNLAVRWDALSPDVAPARPVRLRRAPGRPTTSPR